MELRRYLPPGATVALRVVLAAGQFGTASAESTGDVAGRPAGRWDSFFLLIRGRRLGLFRTDAPGPNPGLTRGLTAHVAAPPPSWHELLAKPRPRSWESGPPHSASWWL